MTDFLHYVIADSLTWIMWRWESRSSVHTYMSRRVFLWNRAVSAASVSSKLQDSSENRVNELSFKCSCQSRSQNWWPSFVPPWLLNSYLFQICMHKHCVWINLKQASVHNWFLIKEAEVWSSRESRVDYLKHPPTHHNPKLHTWPLCWKTPSWLATQAGVCGRHVHLNGTVLSRLCAHAASR